MNYACIDRMVIYIYIYIYVYPGNKGHLFLMVSLFTVCTLENISCMFKNCVYVTTKVQFN